MHKGIVNSARLASLVISKRRVRLDDDTFTLTEAQQLGLLQVWVGLDLVGGRDDVDLAEEFLEAANVEVGYADGTHFAGAQQLLHRFVGADVVDVGEFEDAVGVEWEPFVAAFESTTHGFVSPCWKG